MPRDINCTCESNSPQYCPVHRDTVQRGKVVLVCGDREWTDAFAIERELLFALRHDFGGIDQRHVLVIDGAAPGADTVGHGVAKKLGFRYQRFPADWKKYGKAAGPVRNKQMLKEGKPDLVLAFHANIRQSRGTKDMIDQAGAAGVSWRLYEK